MMETLQYDGAAGPRRIVETTAARLALTLSRPLAHPLMGRMRQLPLDVVVNLLQRRHPRAFQRLKELPATRVLIAPTDLGEGFRMSFGDGRVKVEICSLDAEAEATVEGPFATLLDLFEGKVDGDALFFWRALSITGDMSAVVALRNAIDGEDVNLLKDILPSVGPFAHLSRLLVEGLAQVNAVLDTMLKGHGPDAERERGRV